MSARNVPGGVVSVYKKYTVGSVGIWEKIRRFFAIDPNRSSGVPLNPTYRNPAPGSVPPTLYTDPVTLPAGDIAENPYWKRDVRRNYPRVAVFKQSDIAGLLTLGSAAAPRIGKGEEGQKQLIAVTSEEGTLAKVLEKVNAMEVLSKDGLPPRPGQGWSIAPNEVQSYPPKYPCRNFV
ncbi:NADH-ubiquinone oxidoreductase 21.3 kDa subunit [Sphaerosporella brunnea]|uniref:NADH-ubiquinone oxidoreductase 21.3 kDa subunit n=1 Tax=Sphaerosporella brunnea TaxID=1250544 RepID=A0A5J5EPX6_9PEZI|nr:NADH-ubiquinone oxidoreductase 21.3 kDa subunit [Sphaerosporella brunnea]